MQTNPTTTPRWQQFVSYFWVLALMSVAWRALALRVSSFDAVDRWIEERVLLEGDDVMDGLTFGALQAQWFADNAGVIARGFAHDLGFAILAAAVMCFLGKTVFRIAVVVFVLFLAANVEHVKFNFDHIRMSTLGMGLDPTFVRGSLTEDAVKYAGVIGVAALIGMVFMMQRHIRMIAGYAMMPVVAFIGFFGIASYPDAPNWIQTAPIIPVTGQANLPSDPSRPADASLAWSDQPIQGPGNYNLMIVYLEGLSLASLDRGDMDTLKSLGAQGLQFENFVSRQIITANGLYATLTGDTPSFLQRFPKWEELDPTSDVARLALPNQMRDAGYHTAFLQSAPLAYMSKDAILAHLGFQITLGDASWDEARSRNGWGIDDLSLMERTLDYIDTLPADQPWFVGTLTTGTHAPYNVPGVEDPTRAAALQAADGAIATLIEGLQTRDLTENTVVIITSDEGREAVGGDGFLSDMALNRLPLIVLHPDIKGETQQTYLLNTDLREMALSLTNPIDAQTFMQSLPSHDDIVFGNFITGKIFWYDVDAQSLAGCRVRGFDCQIWEGHETLFDAAPVAPKSAQMPAFEDMIDDHDALPVGHNQ